MVESDEFETNNLFLSVIHVFLVFRRSDVLLASNLLFLKQSLRSQIIDRIHSELE